MIVYGAGRQTSPNHCVPSARKTCVEAGILCRKNIHIFNTFNTSGMLQIMPCWQDLVYPKPLPGSPNLSTKKIPVRGTIKPLKINKNTKMQKSAEKTNQRTICRGANI